MIRTLLPCLLFLIIAKQSAAQTFSFSKEISFVKYLQSKEQFAEADFVLKNIDTLNLLPSQKDSLNYEIAWFAYTQKKLDSAILFFQKISPSDTRFLKASFFAAYCLAFNRKTVESEAVLNKVNTLDSLQTELKTFQLAGLALLNKDYKKYQTYQSSFSFSSYVLKQEEMNFNKYQGIMSAQKKKSPVVAGLLSAVIPGSGKWYAGKKKQGIAAFLPILSSGLLTLEAYNRGGLRDARFWLYGTIFSTFYIGNIWGSAVSVKIKNQEFNRMYENKILFDMHIPLRNFFN